MNSKEIINHDNFKEGLRCFKLKNDESTLELRNAIIKADTQYRRVLDVSNFYKKYLEDKGYTGVKARLIKNNFMKSMQLFGFSADQEIKDENFNSAKIKFNTNYNPLKKTKFNKENTSDLKDLHTSYNDVCELMIGKISYKQYEPTEFNENLGSIFMLYFDYSITDGGQDIKFIIHERDMDKVENKLIMDGDEWKYSTVESEVYKFIMTNFEKVELKLDQTA